LLRHVLPNVLNSVVVLAILDVGRAIILESSLSFPGRRHSAAGRLVGD
jgi:peptide/nickel transport system permease protein